MKVTFTAQALQRLVEIEDHISLDNPRAAEALVDKLITRAEALVDGPGIGRLVPEVPQGDLRELIVNSYRIVYRVRAERVEVLTVFEGHRLLDVDEIG